MTMTGEADTATQRPASKRPSYFAQSVAELKKVQAPTKAETWQQSMAVLALIVFFSVALAVLDWTFRALMWRIL
jgi:preprotein translocase SecE subunit